MRLAQLSRKLQVKPVTIIQYIEKTFATEINSHPNTRIPDEYLENIYEAFIKVEIPKETEIATPPSPIEDEIIVEKIEIKVNETKEEKNKETELQEVEESEKTEEAAQDPNESTEENSEKSSEENSEETVQLNIQDGVIRAPKVEIEGVKVIGKIDIPEKPVAVESTEEGEEGAKSNEKLESNETVDQAEKSNSETTEVKLEPKNIPVKSQNPRKKANKPTQDRQKRQKREISYEEQRRLDKEAYTEAVKRRKEEEKRKAKERYNALMKQKEESTAKKKLSKSKVKKMQEKALIQKKKEEAPTTLWGKFIYWLNN